MTKAGLYHYINGKKELLFDIMNFGLDELDEEVATPAASVPDSIERLRCIIRTPCTARDTRTGRDHNTRRRNHRAARPRKIESSRVANVNTSHRLRELMNLLKSEVSFTDVDTTAATFSLFGMISWLSRRLFGKTDP
jgi:AcrR family transcriptional regulator